MKHAAKTRSSIFFSLGLMLLVTQATTQDRTANALSGRIPHHFIEDRDPSTGEAAYHVRGVDRTLFFNSTGVTVVFVQDAKCWASSLVFEGARRDAGPRGEDRQKAVVSYFKGKPETWRKGLTTYGRLRYEELWPGIDLVYKGNINQLKYEFVVKPGADPGRIRLAYQGVSRLRVDADGGLCAETPLGVLRDEPPVAYQEIGGHLVRVDVAYDVEACKREGFWRYGFRIGKFDREKPLVLDPAVLVYCGYIGGSSSDGVTDIAVDSQGNIYVVGGTHSNSLTFPVKVGPDLTYAGESDVFVAKVDPKGQSLIYCGYIGGEYNEAANGIAVDGKGNAYITGRGGTGYPRKSGPLSKAEGGAFVTKVNASGTDLVYSGIIGGDSVTVGRGIAVDASGCAYITGNTQVHEIYFPVKVGPDMTYNYGVWDAFVAKVNAAGTGLVYCGYIGGGNQDFGYDIAVDPQGRAYVTGGTLSDTSSHFPFPVKVGPDLTFNSSYPPVYADAFVARVNASGSGLDYCGYIGGVDHDYGIGITADKSGMAYVTGIVHSTDLTFPVKVGPDLTYNGGGGDAFVAKVDSTGKSLVYCGYIGGDGQDKGRAIVVDESGAAHVVGYSGSYDWTFPVKHGPGLSFSGLVDAFIAKVDPSGAGLVYCGYIGGKRVEEALGIALDPSGNAYIAGFTESDETTFPVRVGPDLTFNGTSSLPGSDAFVAKVALTLLEGSGTPCPGGAMDLRLTATESPGRPYQAASSFSTGPLKVDTRTLGLGYDGLLWISLSGWVPGTFEGFRGTVGADGKAGATLHIPNIPALIGVRIHTAFVTLDPTAPSGIKSISNTFSFSITK